MQYKLLVLDIDGTLRPAGEPRVPKQTADAIIAVQKQGVKIAIATGRGRGAIPKGMLRGIKPDYWICAAGAEVLDAAGKPLFTSCMTPEEMYALVDFFEDREFPLAFNFADGGYVYVEYDKMHWHETQTGTDECLKDGEDQNHHLEQMPFSAFACIPRPALEDFCEKYGYLGLRFLYYTEEACDVLRPEQDKSVGLAALLDLTGFSADECVAVGDGDNDADMLRMAGLSYCVHNGAESAQAAAGRTCPSASACGVAAVCRELWPAAFGAKEPAYV